MVAIKQDDLLNLLNVKKIAFMIKKFLVLSLIALLISGCAGSKENEKDILRSPCIKGY